MSGEAAVETVDGEIRIRQRERKKGEGEGERKRDEDPKKQDAAGRASMRELNDYGYGLPRLSPIILVPKPVSSTP